MKELELHFKTASITPDYHLVNFMQFAMTTISPSLCGGIVVRTTSGEIPWDFSTHLKWMSGAMGFEIEIVGNAFDTSSGPRESYTARAKSVGLPSGASLQLVVSQDWQSGYATMVFSALVPATTVSAIEQLVNRSFPPLAE